MFFPGAEYNIVYGDRMVGHKNMAKVIGNTKQWTENDKSRKIS